MHYKEDFDFLFDLEKLIEYWASAINVISYTPFVRPEPRIAIPFFIWSMRIGELVSTTKKMAFLPSANEDSERESSQYF